MYDVAVDLRRDSPTFGEHEAFELSDENCRQLFVPVGFAHGFCVTSEVADVTYKVSSYYDGAQERGIAWDDPAIGVEWPVRRADRLGPRPVEPAARGDRRRASLVTEHEEIARRAWDAFNRKDFETSSTRCTRTWNGGRLRARRHRGPGLSRP